MRLGIARIAQETSTFSPILTDLESLRVNGIIRGQAVLKDIPGFDVVGDTYRTRSKTTRLTSAIPGFLDVVGDEQLFGIISAHAMPADREALRASRSSRTIPSVWVTCGGACTCCARSPAGRATRPCCSSRARRRSALSARFPERRTS